jgi:hypothetical protein
MTRVGCDRAWTAKHVDARLTPMAASAKMSVFSEGYADNHVAAAAATDVLAPLA